MDFVALKIAMRAPSADSLEIDLMNEIVHSQVEAEWFGGTTAQDFANKLAGKTPKEITVRINSNGGYVSDGVAIYNLLREKARAGAKITTVNLGIAASISSVVMMAGDVRRVATGARTMIHNAGIMGRIPFTNSESLRKIAGNLDQINETIADIYAKASNGKKTKEEFLDLMAQETTLSADESVAHGLATETDAELKAVACVGSEFFAMGTRPNTADGETTDPVANAATHNEETTVTKEEIVAKFPELAQAFRDEGRAQASVDLAAAATAERERIQGVLAQAMPGHEELVNTLAFDGKSTKADAALAILAVEKKTRATIHTNMRTEAPAAVNAAASSTGNGSAETSNQNLSVEERAQKAWDNDPSLRAEFDEFKDYLAYEKGKANGNVRVKGA